MPTRTRATATQVATLLRLTITRVNRRLRQSRPAGDLTIAQISALQSVATIGGLTLTELAETEGVQPPTMVRIVGRLDEYGLIQRTPHPTDGRQVILSPTPRGQSMIDEYHRVRDEWLARRVARLSAAEREVLQQAAEILLRIAKDE